MNVRIFVIGAIIFATYATFMVLGIVSNLPTAANAAYYGG